MRILMLAHRIPYPPHTGDKVRAFHIARHLAQQHDLTLAFLVDDPGDWPGVEALRREVGQLEFSRLWKPWGMLKGLVGFPAGTPLTLSCFASRKLRGRIARRLSEADYDLIYVSSSSMAQYVEGTAAPVVMDFVDVDSDKWTQYGQRTRPPLAWVYRTEGRRLRRYEAGVARWARLCVLATAAEEALLRSFAPWANTAVVPNGVDLAYYAPNGEGGSEPVLIFTGAMDYRPNIDAVRFFCTDIFPSVRREVPEARFLIVGLNPAPSVCRLASMPGVVVTGAVPDVRPFYAGASVCVAPLRIARGVQNKVLQAMAMRIPVVATRRACEGIAARPGHDVIVEDDPGAFAARVVELLKRPAARAALGRRGRAFVEAHHSWETSLARLDGLLHSASMSRAAAGVGQG
jgi:sugar transferase (PEP-CTERM/EpsH1 system associated)